ncbi:hypothetical protein ACSNOK_05585 [Streptomyces sp. URMC 126]|uniref:hypothetical protein n=1 Tax=Streptomyces sp. URMC 126 TaxID=3423401 RepID=UPI003F197B20
MTRPDPYGPPPSQSPHPAHGGGPSGLPIAPVAPGQVPGQAPGQAPYPPFCPPPLPHLPPPPPPRRSGKGKVIGVAVGLVALIGALSGGFFLFRGGSGGSGGSGGPGDEDGRRYRLLTPTTVLGEFTRNDADGGNAAMDAKENAALGIRDARSAGGEYEAAAGTNRKRLSYHGVWGRIDDPEATVDRLFRLVGKDRRKSGDDDAPRYVGTPRKMRPAGLGDAVMKCQAMRFSAPGKSADMPFCAWADHSTVALVMVADRASVLSGDSGDLDRCAETAVRLRHEVRVAREN